MLFSWCPHPFSIFTSTNYILILLGITSITGDYLVAHTKLHLFQALFDNATHATVGALSWTYVCLYFKGRSNAILEIALCATIASLIDLDHFVSARSFYLKDATNLQKRPPLHCSTFPVVFCTGLLFLSYVFQVEVWKKVALISLTAFVSHHTRDATRRGFWVYPFGSTPPIPYCFYVGLTCVIPVFVCFLFRFVKVEGVKYQFVSKGSVI